MTDGKKVKLIEAALLTPGTVLYGGFILSTLWTVTAAVPERLATSSLSEAVIGLGSIALIYGIPIVSLLAVWCVVLGLDRWVRDYRILRGVLVALSIPVWLYLAVLAIADISSVMTAWTSIYIVGALGLLIVGAVHLVRYYREYWRPGKIIQMTLPHTNR